jgi:sulfoxide reductase catalytic subunit YedY
VLWLLNGVVFYVLLFATGQWHRIVPTTWTVFPSAVSVMIQYLSLHWPTESGWVAYNSLQLLAYFLTVFIVIHVTLVFTTGLLRNLNHVFAGRNDSSWIGFGIFCLATAIMIIAWVAATPFTVRHPRTVQRIGYTLAGPVQRLFEHVDATLGKYGEKDISPYFWHNGAFPTTSEYKQLFDEGFASWRLKIGGLVANPVELPRHEQITQHFCIQGWSGVAKWGGVSMATIVMEPVALVPGMLKTPAEVGRVMAQDMTAIAKLLRPSWALTGCCRRTTSAAHQTVTSTKLIRSTMLHAQGTQPVNIAAMARAMRK